MQCRPAHSRTRRFLSTPSARRATAAGPAAAAAHNHFYPRPPRGGRPAQVTGKGLCVLFLSTPSARRATDGLYIDPTFEAFLSTPSARRATR